MSIASGNVDARLKNWSWRMKHAGRPLLSPVYDQVATISRPDDGSTSSVVRPAEYEVWSFRPRDDARIQLAKETSARQDERDAFIHKLTLIIASRKSAARFSHSANRLAEDPKAATTRSP